MELMNRWWKIWLKLNDMKKQCMQLFELIDRWWKNMIKIKWYEETMYALCSYFGMELIDHWWKNMIKIEWYEEKNVKDFWEWN